MERWTPGPFLAFSVCSDRPQRVLFSPPVAVYKLVVNTPALTSPFDFDGDTALPLALFPVRFAALSAKYSELEDKVCEKPE